MKWFSSENTEGQREHPQHKRYLKHFNKWSKSSKIKNGGRSGWSASLRKTYLSSDFNSSSEKIVFKSDSFVQLATFLAK